MCKTKGPATTLPACEWCDGHCYEPTEEGGPIPCMACGGSGYEVATGDLGPTRSHATRPYHYNPGTRVLTVSRPKGKRENTERYRLTEVPTDATFRGRAWEVVKLSDGEVRYAYIGRDEVSCTCEGKTYESSARAAEKATAAGKPELLAPTLGCLHLDAARELLTLGYLDLPDVILKPVGCG